MRELSIFNSKKILITLGQYSKISTILKNRIMNYDQINMTSILFPQIKLKKKTPNKASRE